MATPKSLVAALGLLAVLGAGTAGWLLLRSGPGAGTAPVGPGVGPGNPAVVGVEPKDPKAAPGGSNGHEIIDEGEDPPDSPRDPHGPVGGATAEEILEAGRNRNWMEVERLMSIAGCDDPRVTQMFLDAMKDGQFRNHAAMLAKYLKDPAALARFLELAKSGADDNTRSAALQASAVMGGPGVFEAAAEILKGATPGGILFSSATQALGTLGSLESTRTLVDMLRTTAGTAVHPMIVQSLSKVRNPEALAELGRMANDEGQDPGLRATLVKALGQTKNSAEVVVPILIQAARDGNTEEIRAAACAGIATVGDPAGVQELVNIVQGADDGRKQAAAMALQHLRNKSAGPILEEAIKGPLPEPLKAYFVEALGHCGGKGALEPLTKILSEKGDNTEGQRTSAVRALGRIGDPSSGKAIVDAIESAPKSDAAFRREAYGALVDTATVEELPRLAALLKGLTTNDPDYYSLSVVVGRLRHEKDAKK